MLAHVGLLAGLAQILSHRLVDLPPLPAGFRLIAVPPDKPRPDAYRFAPALAMTAITLPSPALPEIRMTGLPPSIVEQPDCPPPDPNDPRPGPCEPVQGLSGLNGKLQWETDDKAATEAAVAANMKRLEARFGQNPEAPPPGYERDILPETSGRPWQKLEKWQEENLQYPAFLGR